MNVHVNVTVVVVVQSCSYNVSICFVHNLVIVVEGIVVVLFESFHGNSSNCTVLVVVIVVFVSCY